MKAITWLAAVTVTVTSAITSSAFATPHEGWTADLDKALAQAKKDNLAVLVEFTGSDWCPPCIMMRQNVFSKKEFVKKASKDFVLVELDFPKGDKALSEKNQPFAEKYKIDGFPTIVLLDSGGQEFSRFYASEYPSIDAFVAHISKQLERKDFD